MYHTTVAPHDIRFEVILVDNRRHIYWRRGAVPRMIPELATRIHIQQSEIGDMITATERYVDIDPGRDLEYHDAGCCYRPTAIPNHSIVGMVGWDQLSKESQLSSSYEPSTMGERLIAGGNLIDTGHSRDGITLGIGGGKVASNSVLGKRPSVDISSLGLPDGSHL